MGNVYSERKQRKKEALFHRTSNTEVGSCGWRLWHMEQIPSSKDLLPAGSSIRWPRLPRIALPAVMSLLGSLYEATEWGWDCNKAPIIWQDMWQLCLTFLLPNTPALGWQMLGQASIAVQFLPLLKASSATSVTPYKYLLPQTLSQHLLRRTKPATKSLTPSS